MSKERSRGLKRLLVQCPAPRAIIEILETRQLLSAAVAAALPPAVGSISGTVFHDDNGDGKASAGEAPIAGRRMYIDANLNQAYDPETEAASSALTDAAGRYTIPLRTYGTQVFRQVVPLGSESTGIAAFYYSGGGDYHAPDFTSRESAAVGDVTVAAWQDATGNDRREATDGALGGLSVYLDFNNNGRRDGSEPVATTAADTGTATFVGVPTGDHVVRATMPYDYAQTSPTQGTGVGARVFAGKVADAGSFGLAPASLFARVSGFVFNDANADGVLQPGEQALLAGRTVYADFNGNATLDSGEPFMTTVVDGYSLSLRPGTYTLRQLSPANWRQTSPAADAGATVTVQAGLDYRQDFGTVPNAIPTASPGGPYTVNEGTPLTLTAQPSSTGQSPFTYEWDFAYDGQTFRPTNTGASVAFPSDIINGPTARTIALRVRDGYGIVSDVVTTTVTVNNVAPTATFAGAPSAVQAGQSSTLVFSNPTDPSAADVAAGFRYSFDLDGDRVYDIVDSASPTATVPGANLTFTGPKLLFGRITDKDGGSTEYVTSIQVAPADGYAGTPFSGTPIAIPVTGTTTVQVENFDNGGEGVAYHDLDAANVGGNAYRSTGVDLESITDGSAGVGVGYAKAGEWLKYSVNVAQAGAYNVGFRVASLKTGGSIHLEVDGAKVGSSITVPDTAAWTTWKTITLNNVQLPAGQHVIKLAFDTNGGIGYVGNFNSMTFTKTTVTPPPPPPTYTGTPFKGTPAKVNATGSSTIELENFDDGGEGVAYHDTDSANLGKTTYRTGGVDVEAINDGGAGYGLGYAKAGEWLKYTVDVAADGTYDLDVRLASLSGGGAFHLEVDGVRLAANVTVPKTGAWTTYASVRQPLVSLKAGRHVVRLVMDANGSTGYVANFNWMRFTRH